MTKWIGLGLAFIAGTVLLTCQTNAAIISTTIINQSFEDGTQLNDCSVLNNGCAFSPGGTAPTGWTRTGSAGAFTPGVFTNIFYDVDDVPDGESVGYANDGGSLSQTLTGTALTAGSTYTLQFYVGQRADDFRGVGPVDFVVELSTVGGDVLASLDETYFGAADSNGYRIEPGSFEFAEFSYTATGQETGIGDMLFIEFKSFVVQTNWDDVVGFVTTSDVPEPAAIGLFVVGLLGLQIARRRGTTA